MRSQVAQARNIHKNPQNSHKSARGPHRRDVTHILSEASFFYWNPFIFVGYRNDRFFSHTNPYISNVTQQCRCSPIIFRAWATCGDITENGKKNNRFRLANNFARAFAHASHFWILYVSLPSLHDCDVKMPSSTFCGEREHKTTTLFLFSWTSKQSFKIQLKKNFPTFDDLNQME